MQDKDYTFRYFLRYPLMRDALVIFTLVVATTALYYLWRIFLPLAIGLILGYLTHPVVDRLNNKWGVNRNLSSAVIVGSSVMLILIFMGWASPIILEQSTSLVERLPSYLKTLQEKTGVNLSELAEDKSAQEWIDQSLANLKSILNESGKIFGVLKILISKAFYFFFACMAIPIFWFYFSAHFQNVKGWVNDFIPASKKDKFHYVLKKMDHAVFGFFKGRILIVTIMGLMFSFGWWLAGVPFWFLLGMFTGILNIAPYLSVVGWPLAILAKYIEYEQQGQLDISLFDVVFWPSLVYGVVQFIEGWFMTPYIQSEQTFLSFPVILMAIFVGGALGGILGMILAIPLTACIKILLSECLFPALKNWAENH